MSAIGRVDLSLKYLECIVPITKKKKEFFQQSRNSQNFKWMAHLSGRLSGCVGGWTGWVGLLDKWVGGFKDTLDKQQFAHLTI